MSSIAVRTKFAPQKKIECFFTQKQIEVSNNGEYIFCQCQNSVNIVLVSSGEIIHRIENEDEAISSLSLSPNNSSLVIGFSSSNIKHYKIADSLDFEPTHHFSFKSYHRGSVLTMNWDDSSTLLATGCSEGAVRVWDINKKFCTHSLQKTQGVIRVLLFNKNLNERPWLVSAADETIYIWVLQAGNSKIVCTLKGHDSSVTGLKFSHCNNKLISSGLDKVIILWDLNSFQSLRIIPVFESLSGLILQPMDTNFLGKKLKSEKSNVIFTIGNKGVPRVWDVDNGKEIWKGSEPVIPPTDKEVLLINQIHLVKSKNSIAITTHDNVIALMHCESMKIWKQLVGFNDEILDAVFLGEDRSHVAIAANSSQIRIYEYSSKNCKLVSGHTEIVLALANHPSQKIIFGSSSHDNTARIWKLTSDGEAECLAIATGHTHSIGALALAGDFLVTGSRDTCLKRWNMNFKKLLTGKEIESLSSIRTRTAHEKDINNLSISKDFSLIATASVDKTVKVWNSDTLELIDTLNGHRKGVWSVQFSPTDRLLATASADGTIKIWSLTNYTNVSTLEGHEAGVLRIAWLSQGQQLLSGDSAGLLKLWTVKNSLCVDTFDEHSDRLWTLSVIDDGNEVVTGGSDSTLIWWKDVTEEEKKKEKEESQRLIEEEQMLLNLLHEKKWAKALRLSLRLKQPFRGLNIMKALLDESPSSLPIVLRGLRKNEIDTLLDYAVQWNTKSKNVREAQVVINFLLKEYLPEELEVISNWKTTLEGLLPYTERHLKRLSALHQSTTIIQYMTSCMSLGTCVPIDNFVENKLDEETTLLQTIPRDFHGPITVEDENEECTDSDGESEDGKDVLNEPEQWTGDDIPLESLDDIRSNFTYEKIVTDEESSDNEESRGS